MIGTRTRASVVATVPPAGDAWTRFVAGAVFPLHERLKRHSTVRVLRALEASQWWSPERLAALQAERLRALVTHAGEHVPYYRDLFRREGIDPRGITGIADLQRLPLLTKADIRANPDALRSEQAKALARFNTGGSSGEPLVFWIGKERVSHDVAAKWRATRWWGVDIGDPEIVVWGSPIEVGAQDRARGLRDRLLRTQLLPAFEMSIARLDAYVEAIRRARPRMLFGYPSALALIAQHAATRNVRLDALDIRVAFVTAERLYDHQRAAIEAAFGCPVANGYGGRDAGFVAHTCPRGGMHITAEDVIVETLTRDGRPAAEGEAGEIVVTHLATADYPFIRYRTGDVGVLDVRACACGRGLPLLREIQGRTTDFVVAADGTVMHGLALVYVVRDLPGVAAFRIVQESRSHTRVEIVPGAAWDAAAKAAIERGFRARLGADTTIEVQEVTQIAPEASGKHRYVVSRVAA